MSATDWWMYFDCWVTFFFPFVQSGSSICTYSSEISCDRLEGGAIGDKLKAADLEAADAHGYVAWCPLPTASELLGDTCTATGVYRLISAVALFL